MNILHNLIIFIIQTLVSFLTLFCIYMVLVFIDNDFGFDGFLGLVFFQPILAVILSGITIFFCFLLGLPIRLNSKINVWYRKHFYISIIGFFIGISLLIIAFMPAFKESVNYVFEDEVVVRSISNLFYAIFGWFLIAFSTLHIYPPKVVTDRLQKIFRKKKLF